MSRFEKGDFVSITKRLKMFDGFVIRPGDGGEIIRESNKLYCIHFNEFNKQYWIKPYYLTLRRKAMKNYIYVHGRKIPLSDETAKEMAKSFKEDELTSFEDCWNKIFNKKSNNRFYYLHNGEINEWVYACPYEGSDLHNSRIPRKELARKVQLYIQLLNVAEAVNDGWVRDINDDTSRYFIYIDGKGDLKTGFVIGVYSDIYFKNRELAEKALKICPELWKEYLSIQ